MGMCSVGPFRGMRNSPMSSFMPSGFTVALYNGLKMCSSNDEYYLVELFVCQKSQC